MKKIIPHVFCILVVLVLLFAAAGCAGSRAKIRTVDFPKANELRSDWRKYHTYCLGSGDENQYSGDAILFRLKGDQAIQLDADWREVTNDQTAAGCASDLRRTSPVMQLLGTNNEPFGYVIYNFRDNISALMVDPKTMRLFYHIKPMGGGH